MGDIIKCKSCGTETDEFLLYKELCYDCSDVWFCNECGEEFRKEQLSKDGGLCKDCAEFERKLHGKYDQMGQLLYV